jgi:hypothetical protein
MFRRFLSIHAGSKIELLKFHAKRKNNFETPHFAMCELQILTDGFCAMDEPGLRLKTTGGVLGSDN